ncbi:hypothetical protein [Desulfopila inferna]|uniref:hypothetical protein n=1 Tax=Desulfopila inferna TaxID=468528 RepID=UPI0019651BC6|nr:hypothetical protein [Desulfopila inferna]MBM9604134.1 hypothetical protein [Desulfopila inferna]
MIQSKRVATVIICTFLFAFFIAKNIYAAEPSYEVPQAYSAGKLLQPEFLQGKYHKVDDHVEYDGFFYHFTVQSDFGNFKAISIASLVNLIKELSAIAAMKEVETSDTAVSSLQQSGKKTVEGVKSLFTDPEGTLKGAGQGVSSLFHRAKVTIGSRKLTDAEDSRMEQFIGLTKSKGEIANKYGVSIYSRNEVLQEELDRLAMADYLGGISVGLATSAISGVGGLVLSASGTARLLNETINITSPSELWLQNEEKLIAITNEPDTVKLFLNNPVFTPALQTVMTAALQKLEGVGNRDLFLKIGLQASTPDMAKIMTELAVMAAAYHERIAPLADFSSMARLLKARTKDGTVVVILPVDHLIWSSRVASVAEGISEEIPKEKASNLEIWTLGSLSAAAQSSFETAGWHTNGNAHGLLFPSLHWPVKQTP